MTLPRAPLLSTILALAFAHAAMLNSGPAPAQVLIPNYNTPAVNLDALNNQINILLTQIQGNPSPSQGSVVRLQLAVQQFTNILQLQSSVTKSILDAQKTIINNISSSCPVFVDRGTLLGEDSCVWTKVTGRRTDQFANGGLGFDDATYLLGGQKEFAPAWFIESAFGAGTTWMRAGGGDESRTQNLEGSVALKHTLGPWLFLGSIAGATSSSHISRLVSLQGANVLLQTDPSVVMAGGRLRAAYDFAFDGWYARPRMDFDLFRTRMSAFLDSDKSLLAPLQRGLGKVSAVASPRVEFGARYDLGPTTLRPYVDIGASFFSGDESRVDEGFAGTLAAIGRFQLQTSVKQPSALGVVDLGIQLYEVGGFEVKVEYNLKGAKEYLSEGGGLRVAYHF